MTHTCYCDSGKLFESCCGPLLSGEKSAASPEELMRSRYSAFCAGNVTYLLQTHLPEKHSPDEAAQIKVTMEHTQWRKLQVQSAETDGTRGKVEFIAFYSARSHEGDKLNATVEQLHERSNFIKRDDHWFYVDGLHLPALKLQRNDPCWCGSSKKFKKCCGQ